MPRRHAFACGQAKMLALRGCGMYDPSTGITIPAEYAGYICSSVYVCVSVRVRCTVLKTKKAVAVRAGMLLKQHLQLMQASL
jgi:hypothetical protein